MPLESRICIIHVYKFIFNNRELGQSAPNIYLGSSTLLHKIPDLHIQHAHGAKQVSCSKTPSPVFSDFESTAEQKLFHNLTHVARIQTIKYNGVGFLLQEVYGILLLRSKAVHAPGGLTTMSV